MSINGNVAAIPLRLFDSQRAAENVGDSLGAEIGDLLSKAQIVVPVGKGDEVQHVMGLAEFFKAYLRVTGMRPLVCTLDYDDGAPELIVTAVTPGSKGIIVPG